jgi:hypothetical protein
VRFAIASARAAADLEHAGVKGAIREVLIADLFRPLLPADIGAATGILISAFDNKQSAQQDIVLFDRHVLPPLLFEQGPAIIPVESAFATVEVKSCLSATELKNAHDNARTTMDLDLQSGVQDKHGAWLNIPTPGPSPLLFALGSDLAAGGKTEVKRYAEARASDPPFIRGICVAGKGSYWPQERFVFDKPSGSFLTQDDNALRDEWYEVTADGEHQEILEVLRAIHKLMLEVTSSRIQPPLHGYLK